MSADEEKRLEYKAREKALRDYNSQMNSAERRGLKAGQELGEKIGEKRGKELGEKIGQELGEKIGEKRGKELGEKIGRELGEKIGEKRGKELGEKIGQKLNLIALIQKKVSKGKSLADIAEDLEEDVSQIEDIYTLVVNHPGKTSEELIKIMQL